MNILRLGALALLIAAESIPAPIGGSTRAQESDTVEALRSDSAALEAQVREVASSLRCPVCLALSIQDSPSSLAEDMRDVIRDRLRAGETPDEVREYFVSRYGEWVLLEPRAEGFNLAVWTLPVALLLTGLVFVIWLARRWSRRAPDVVDEPASAEELARSRKELERWEAGNG